MNKWSKNMNEWINNCNEETLREIIQAARKINNNYQRMKDSIILEKLINNEIMIYQIISYTSEEIQLAVVKQCGSSDGFLIRWIPNPSEEVKLAAGVKT
jgi:hypothetical protein